MRSRYAASGAHVLVEVSSVTRKLVKTYWYIHFRSTLRQFLTALVGGAGYKYFSFVILTLKGSESLYLALRADDRNTGILYPVQPDTE